MFNHGARSAKLGRTVQRALSRATMATAAPRIGDSKALMSPLETNLLGPAYQRIEDTLAVVRSRYVLYLPCAC